MNGERHELARAIYLEALRQPIDRQAAFVVEACGDDRALAAEVGSLMQPHADAVETGAPFTSPPPSPPALRPGELFADRYRIVELLGRGGMGDVYRAHDVMLDAPVALKRLRSAGVRDAQRVIDEVRTARAITHRAVCRVFDVGEAGGEYYFTMEYVDGEDLAVLLRRIGRLSSPKTLDIARQLCAGLAAAHARGVLHRDLKPANVLMDASGDVRITDFGIAVAATASAQEQRAGTPAYMAPEVLRGAPASVQSEIYALGIVLFELVTGGRPFGPFGRGPAATPPRPSSLVPDIDPRLDAAIAQALDEQPGRRPASALALLSMLPGGDLLQDALDAGAMPPPDIVAAAGTTGGLAPRLGLPLLLVSVASLLVVLLTPPFRLIDRDILGDAPGALEAKARAFLADVTGRPPQAYRVFRLQANTAYLRHLRLERSARVDPSLAARVVYRDATEPIVPAFLLNADRGFEPTLENPPLGSTGARAVVLDGGGRLESFRAYPAARPLAPPTPLDWTRFLHETGVDPATVEPVAPAAESLSYGTHRFAWRARYPGATETVRIEAAAVGNEPTWFEVEQRWTPENTAAARSTGMGVAGALFGVAIVAVSIVLAWRNLASGRGDLRGAGRLAVTFFVCFLGASILPAAALPLPLAVARTFIFGALALAAATIAGVLYVALEPIVRRRWPWSLIGWSRLLAGRWRDPLVGRDVLIGVSASLIGTAMYCGAILVLPGLAPERSTSAAVHILMGGRHFVARLLSIVPNAAFGGMLLALLYTLLVMVVRRGWVAAVVLFVFLTATTLVQADASALEAAVVLVAQALFVIVWARFGLLSLVAYFVMEELLADFPLAFSPDWRTEYSAVTVLVILALVVLSAWTTLRNVQTAVLRGDAVAVAERGLPRA